MADPAKVNEPSMDDILSSIRQIIADEDETDAPGVAAEEVAEEAAPEVETDLIAMEDDAAAEMAEEETIGDMIEPTPETEPESEMSDVLELGEEQMIVDEPPDDDFEAGADPEMVVSDNISFDDIADSEPEAVIDDTPIVEELAIEEPEIEEAPVVAIEPDPVPMEQPAPVEQPAPEVAAAPIVSSTTDDVVRSALADLSRLVMQENTRTLEDVVREMLKPMMKTWLDEQLPRVVEDLVREEIQRITKQK